MRKEIAEKTRETFMCHVQNKQFDIRDICFHVFGVDTVEFFSISAIGVETLSLLNDWDCCFKSL